MMKQGTGNREQGTGKLSVVLAAVVLCLPAAGQQIQLGDATSAATAKKQHVMLISDAVDVAAGVPQFVELKFRVDPGFHINSHVPKDELLIPTTLKLDDAAGIKVLVEEYPAGAAFKLGDSGETLDVYQGEFRIRLRMTVAKGESTLSGTLHYQACDNAACFPPRTLAVRVAIQGK